MAFRHYPFAILIFRRRAKTIEQHEEEKRSEMCIVDSNRYFFFICFQCSSVLSSVSPFVNEGAIEMERKTVSCIQLQQDPLKKRETSAEFRNAEFRSAEFRIAKWHRS